MSTNRVFQNQENKRGAALLTLMIVVLLVAGTGAYMVQDAKQQMHAVTRVRDYLKAQAYAEGGANQAYSLLKTNFALRTDPSKFPLTTYSDGMYDVTVTSVGTNMASISCIGQRGASTVNVVVDLQNFAAGTGSPGGTSAVPPAVGAYTYAIVSGGSITLSGSGTLNVGSGGKLHSNSSYTMTGSKKVIGNISSSVSITLSGSTKITGNAAAPVISASGSAVTGSKTIGPVPVVTIPDFDATAYKNVAVANGAGAYYAGDAKLSGSGDIAPPGGILYAEGDIQISGSGKMIGCFIAGNAGTVKISGSGDQIQVGNYPAFVSVNGNLDMSGSGKINGLLYAGSSSGTPSFDRSGSGDVTGSIISKGAFKGSGSWSALTYANSTPVPPASGGGNGTSGSGDRVGVIAWQK